MKSLGFVSICTNSYLPQAILLNRSLQKVYNQRLGLVCVERAVEGFDINEFEYVKTAHELFGDEFERIIFRYGVVEAATAIKARVLKDALRNFGSVVYLDPDILLYSKFDELHNSQSIIATPHIVGATQQWTSIFENELRVLRHGMCNLGFLYLPKNKATAQFLEWWEQRLLYLCFEEPGKGLYVDQKWFDLAIGIFQIELIRHPGYNVANWNASSRSLADNNGILSCGGYPVRFFHFSGCMTGRDLQSYAAGDLSEARYAIELRNAYNSALSEIACGMPITRTPWSYSTFSSGEMIQRRARKNWAFRPPVLDKSDLNPFLLSNHLLTASL